jgi:preprotein translocase SecE subunit
MIVRPIQYIKEAKIEITKVSWPSRNKVIQYTIIVIIISFIAILIFGGLDILFNYILTKFIIT